MKLVTEYFGREWYPVEEAKMAMRKMEAIQIRRGSVRKGGRGDGGKCPPCKMYLSKLKVIVNM